MNHNKSKRKKKNIFRGKEGPGDGQKRRRREGESRQRFSLRREREWRRCCWERDLKIEESPDSAALKSSSSLIWIPLTSGFGASISISISLLDGTEWWWRRAHRQGDSEEWRPDRMCSRREKERGRRRERDGEERRALLYLKNEWDIRVKLVRVKKICIYIF